MATLELQIDELYQQPLDQFVAARNALAKTLDRADAARVRRLDKPTVVPWAVNQVYWRARPVYERLLEAGDRLRRAQVAALEGRRADVRGAAEAHRRAIADAAREAEAVSATAGAHPSPDALSRTLEALSLGPAPSPPGRLTQALQPAGFEALAGIAPHGKAPSGPGVKSRSVAGPGTRVEQPPPIDRDDARRAARAAEVARRSAERAARTARAEIAAVERAVALATRAEAAARERWEKARRDLESAERKLRAARQPR
ncbi:MAG: hypothetical protein ACM3SQ_09115 [Betaproteobacteria bacterium]